MASSKHGLSIFHLSLQWLPTLVGIEPWRCQEPRLFQGYLVRWSEPALIRGL